MRLALPLLAAAAYALYRSRSGRSPRISTARTWPGADASLARNDADSPNAAERLKSSHLGGAFAGLGSEDGAPPPQLRSSKPDEIVTGLPDLMRGA